MSHDYHKEKTQVVCVLFEFCTLYLFLVFREALYTLKIHGWRSAQPALEFSAVIYSRRTPRKVPYSKNNISAFAKCNYVIV